MAQMRVALSQLRAICGAVFIVSLFRVRSRPPILPTSEQLPKFQRESKT